MYMHSRGPSNGPDVEQVAKNDSMCCYFGILQIQERLVLAASTQACLMAIGLQRRQWESTSDNISYSEFGKYPYKVAEKPIYKSANTTF